MKQHQRIYLEVLRIVAAFCVITNHINNPLFYYSSMSKSWFASQILFYFCKIAVPIFLMISGGLLLERKDSMEKHIRRIVRCGLVVVIFTIVYYMIFVESTEWGLFHWFKYVLGSVTNAYWYLYLYIGILIMLPILQKITGVLDKKTLEYFLGISLGIGGLVPMLPLFTGYEIKNEFLEVLFSPYLGMLFAGYYIEKYVTVTRKKAWIATGVMAFCIIFQVIVTAQFYMLDKQDYMKLDNRIFLPITLSAICFYILIKYIFSNHLPEYLSRIIVYCGGLTFGIYLLGDLVTNLTISLFFTYREGINTFIGLFTYSCFVFLICGICTAILKVIPFVKKLL